jgi:hypothetical protein
MQGPRRCFWSWTELNVVSLTSCAWARIQVPSPLHFWQICPETTFAFCSILATPLTATIRFDMCIFMNGF